MSKSINHIDAQLLEAQKDIERSSQQIGQLESLDREKFPFIDSMIEFHRLRISNCQKALKSPKCHLESR